MTASELNLTSVTPDYLSTESIRSFRIPQQSRSFQDSIGGVFSQAIRTQTKAVLALQKAEATLLQALNLSNWQAPEPLSYTRSSSDAFAAGRLDAEHFQPKFQALLAHLLATGQAKNLGDVLQLNQRGKQPEYIESGIPVVNSKHINKGEVRIDSDNRCAQTDDETVLIQPGDVVMNGTGVGTIGRAAPYLHNFGAVPDNHVTILKPKPGMDAVYLSVFINSLAGQMQVAQRLRGSSGQIELYPNDIARFMVWDAPEEVQANIRQLVIQSFEAKQRATQLLDAAKRAVEIAIEESEDAALLHLQLVTNGSVEHLSALDPLDVSVRLHVLSALADGWLDGKGLAPAKDGLRWLAQAFDDKFDAGLVLPYLYPTPEGGVQAEWSVGDWEVSLEMDLLQKTGEYQAVNVTTHEVADALLALGGDDGWQALNQQLSDIGGKQA